MAKHSRLVCNDASGSCCASVLKYAYSQDVAISFGVGAGIENLLLLYKVSAMMDMDRLRHDLVRAVGLLVEVDRLPTGRQLADAVVFDALDDALLYLFAWCDEEAADLVQRFQSPVWWKMEVVEGQAECRIVVTIGHSSRANQISYNAVISRLSDVRFAVWPE